MTPTHVADCDECPWSFEGDDVVEVSDEMERHARKEQHDVDFQRAVVTDGGVIEYDCGNCGTVHGCDVDETGQRRCPDCSSIVMAVVTDGGRDDVADALYEALAALADLDARIRGGASRSGVSAERVVEEVFDAYDLEEASEVLERTGYERGGASDPEDFAIDELVCTDGGQTKLGEVHAASVLDVDGNAVLAIKGTEATASVVVSEDKVTPFEETVDEIGLVYQDGAGAEGALVGDGGWPRGSYHDTLERALDLWGKRLQVIVAIEELSELTTELARLDRWTGVDGVGPSEEDVMEEIADARIMLDQLALLFDADEIDQLQDEKIQRLDRMIEDEEQEVVTDGGQPVDDEWDPQPASLREGETRDDTAHARTNAKAVRDAKRELAGLGESVHYCDVCGVECADLAELAGHECRPDSGAELSPRDIVERTGGDA